MTRYTGILLVTLSVAASKPLTAQQAPNATSLATVPARPADVSSADAILSALYAANEVMVDRKQDMDRFRSLFVPGARLMPTVRPPNGTGIIRIQSVEDYVRQASSGQPRHGFSEREIARTSQSF